MRVEIQKILLKEATNDQAIEKDPISEKIKSERKRIRDLQLKIFDLIELNNKMQKPKKVNIGDNWIKIGNQKIIIK